MTERETVRVERAVPTLTTVKTRDKPSKPVDGNVTPIYVQGYEEITKAVSVVALQLDNLA